MLGFLFKGFMSLICLSKILDACSRVCMMIWLSFVVCMFLSQNRGPRGLGLESNPKTRDLKFYVYEGR